MSSMDNVKVVLVGLGPHAKRIYMKCFQVNDMEPTLIIDLESKKNEVESYVQENNLKTETLFVDESERNALQLSVENQNKIIEKVKELKITHAIISTEPKAHYAYITLFMKNGIHVLVDKPLTAPVNVSIDQAMAQRIQDEYESIKDMYCEAKKNNVILQVQCQRRWHKGYQLIYKIAEETVKKYQVPITAIQISHCDGMWNMDNQNAYFNKYKEKLYQLLIHCKTDVTYYRENYHFEIPDYDDFTLDFFQNKVPLLEKRIVREDSKCFIIDGMDEKRLSIDSTSGTEGKPIICYRSIKGPNVMRGYYRNEEKMKKTIRNHKLFTGDLAHMDEEGFLYVTGRKDNMFIRGGKNIYPEEIEGVLNSHPDILEALIEAKNKTNEVVEIIAYIVLKENATYDADAIWSHCKKRLEDYKVPKELNVVESLKKTPSGKIMRNQFA